MVSPQERIPVDLLENGKEWGKSVPIGARVVGSRRGVRWPCTEGGGEEPGASREREGLGNENTFVEQLWLERLVSRCLISWREKVTSCGSPIPLSKAVRAEISLDWAS